MNILIEDLDEETVEKLRKQAAGKQRSLEADIKVIIEETVQQREQWKTWRERTRRIADEIRQSGQKFPDTTELIHEEKAMAQDWSRTWAEADRIHDELRATGRKFSNSTELLREDRER